MVQCQDLNDYDQVDNPVVLPFITTLVNSRLSNLASVLSKDISDQASFCIKDQESDWNKAFNFSSNLDFLASCIQKTRGDITRRLCTAAEGWACSIGPNQQVDLENSQVVPARTHDCHACCEGFFCPRCLTCMIPCSLGSHCPVATLNNATGICEPYSYQLPAGRLNHTCGGANIWADVRSRSEVFCSAGSYCPTTTREKPCSCGLLQVDCLQFKHIKSRFACVWNYAYSCYNYSTHHYLQLF